MNAILRTLKAKKYYLLAILFIMASQNAFSQSVSVESSLPEYNIINNITTNKERDVVEIHFKDDKLKLHKQKISLPKGWYLEEEKSVGGLPVAIPWHPNKRINSIVFVTINHEYAIWEWRRLLIYQLDRNKWNEVNINPSFLTFSNLGSFYIRRDILYTWDIQMESNSAHYDDHQYLIHLIKWNKQIYHTAKTTIKHYPVFGILYKGYKALPQKEKDPLNELGLRWAWWK